MSPAAKLGLTDGALPLRDRFQLLARAGFQGVEVESPGVHAREEVAAAIRDTGLTLHGVLAAAQWHRPLSHPDPAVRAAGRAALEDALRDAAAWGATTVSLVPAVVSRAVGYAQAWATSQAELARVLPLAEDLGVAIALENAWNGFLLSPLEARRYVDELASPALGFCLDVGEVLHLGFPQDWIGLLGDRLLKLDAKDFSRARRDAEGLWRGFDVELAEGDCDWPAVTAALDAIGYTGWITADVAGGDLQRLSDVAARLLRILAT